MFAIHIHTLFHVDSLRRNTQRPCKVAGLERADLRRRKSACAPKLQMNYEIDRWFLTEITRNPSQGDSERLLIWFSPLWSLALWMGKMSYYETPECALLCSQLKGMLLSVRGSPLICECSVPGQRIKLMICVNVCERFDAPVTSRFCQKCLVQQA